MIPKSEERVPSMAFANLLFINNSAESFSSQDPAFDRPTTSMIKSHAQRNAKQKHRRSIRAPASRQVGRSESDPEGSSPDSLHAYSSSPLPPPDSLVLSLGKLDITELEMLRYFSTAWMSSDRRKYRHQITGFAPIRITDSDLGHAVVQGALQSPDATSIKCLLTAVSQRMHFFKLKSHQSASSPEHYFTQSIQSIREGISTSRQPSERLMLDISYLVIGELYRPPPSRSLVFRKMFRDLVILYGGLANVQPFTAQAALAWDFFTAHSEVSLPLVNPMRDCRLLGIIKDDSRLSEIREEAAARLAKLDPRVQVFVEEIEAMTQVVIQIRQFPPLIVQEIIEFVRANTVQHHELHAAALLWYSGSRGRDNVLKQNETVAADGLWMHLRQQALRAWLWHTSIAFYAAATVADDLLLIEAPETMAQDISRFADSITRIYVMLIDTGWIMRKDMVLWISALGILVGDFSEQRDACCRWLTKVAKEMSITTEMALQEAMHDLLPLGHICANVSTVLWEALIDEQRWWVS